MSRKPGDGGERVKAAVLDYSPTTHSEEYKLTMYVLQDQKGSAAAAKNGSSSRGAHGTPSAALHLYWSRPFGPMEVTVGRRREKRYGVIFTCLTVRAIHIEIVNHLTTDAFIMALRRMASRRGWPRHLYSDNGTNLRGAATELKKCVQELDLMKLKEQVMSYSTATTWNFNPPASPHWGGAWERLIRNIKSALKVTLKERAPRDETLQTLMAEVEHMVNSRPLSHVAVEPHSQEILTPNHFLLGTSSNLPTLGVYGPTDTFLRKQWRISQMLADMFWKRWVVEVLPDMRPRTKWCEDRRPLEVGDLVLVVDPNLPRGVWPKGLITSVLPEPDGRIRVVEVKTKSGVMRRPATRIAQENSLLANSQHGFRPNKSTAGAVQELTDFIVTHLDNKEKIIGVFLDLAKAFDTVAVVPGAIHATDLITPIINSSGLYFDAIGTLTYYNSFWNVITYTDFSYIAPHLENIRNVLNTPWTTCHTFTSSKLQTDCSNILNPLESLLNNVNKNYKSLGHLTGNKRTKRSWFGIGGPILKQLFGSLDEDDAKIFSNAINAVQDDQRQIASLMKDNIHVVYSTISTSFEFEFNNTIQKLNNNEQTLNSNMEKLDKILENMLQSTDKFAVTNQLALTFSALESSLMTINFNLENIIDSILFGKQNIVHPPVLSPIELYDELSSNQNHIAQNFPLPLHLDNILVHKFFDISDISSFINDTKLIFVVRIPLVLLTEYNQYHLYALSTAHDINNPSSFAMINPNAKYLAITDDKLTYSILDSVSEYKVISKNKHLCKLNNILSTITSPICEVTILTEYVNKIPDTCNYKVIIGDVSVWQKLNYNKWIYVQSHITKLTINCDDKINDYDIVGTGILTLSKNCKAFHKLLQFIPSVEYESKIFLFFYLFIIKSTATLHNK
ncbi:uncharacterized protein ACR2FA_009626 [Aphomia sociella]